ncbi:hypothetical protein LTS10_003022 [Elasticomyces elasticus]|nr:hypothetical protein LTS10_003022 [Elasticomyces elasticus]
MDSSISPNEEKDEMTRDLEAALAEGEEGETSDNPVTVDGDNVSGVPVIDLSDDSAAAPVVKPTEDVPAVPAPSLAKQLEDAVRMNHPTQIEKLKLAIAKEQQVLENTKLQAEMFAEAKADYAWKPQRAAKTAPLPVKSSSPSPPPIKEWPTEEFLYFCRYCSSQQKTATNLRAHMYGTHQLFEPEKMNDLHKCGFCEKCFVTANAVCPRDKFCARTVNTAGWAPVKVDEMTEQDKADTWCRAEHGTPSMSVMRPNPNFTGTPSKKRRSDDEENTRPTKQMRTAIPAPPHRTMPSRTSSEDDDDVQFVSSTRVNQAPDTLSAPPNVQEPVPSAVTVQSMAYTPAGSQHPQQQGACFSAPPYSHEPVQSAATVQNMAYTLAGSQHPQQQGACFSAPPFSQEPMHSAAIAEQGLMPLGSQHPQQWNGMISGPPYVQQAAYSASTAVGAPIPQGSQYSQQPNTVLPPAPYSHGPVQSASTGAQALTSRGYQHTQPPNATLPVAPYGQVPVYSAREAIQQATPPEDTFNEMCAREGVDPMDFLSF